MECKDGHTLKQLNKHLYHMIMGVKFKCNHCNLNQFMKPLQIRKHLIQDCPNFKLTGIHVKLDVNYCNLKNPCKYISLSNHNHDAFKKPADDIASIPERFFIKQCKDHENIDMKSIELKRI